MQPDAAENPFDRLARAMATYNGYQARRQAGSVETFAELLAVHADLRELLQDLAEGESAEPVPPSANVEPVPAVMPTIVGPYRLDRPLGKGAHGVVWLAWDTRVKREVALKLLNQTGIDDDVRLERFAREARAVAQLDHPGICKIYDLERGLPQPWIAMQYVAGQTLEQRLLAGKGLPVTRDAFAAYALLVEKVARALHHAHQHGLVHRDVKPSNVMVTPSGDPVLLDFGIVREESTAGQLTLTEDAIGSPAYMAPEQLASAKVDARVDVWALGVILYECLGGRRPFAAPTREGLLLEIRDVAQPPLRRLNRRVPKELDVVVRKALEKHLGDRYQSAAALAEDLRRWREHEPVLARRSGVGLRTWRWSQRHPLPAGLIVVLVAAVAVIGWQAWSTSVLLESLSFALKRALAGDASFAFQAAQQHASYGRWGDAEERYRQAESLRYDPVAIALGRIEVWDATFQTDRSRSALDELANRSDLGPHAALVTLMRYDLSRRMAGDMPKDWQDNVRSVAFSPDLSAAWKAYAKALLAETFPEARQCVEAVLVEDRRHRAANEMLWPLVLLTEGPTAASYVARAFAELYPFDPAAVFMRVASLRLLERSSEAQELLRSSPIPEPEQNLIDFAVDFRDAVRGGWRDLMVAGMETYPLPPTDQAKSATLSRATRRLTKTLGGLAEIEGAKFMFRLPPAAVLALGPRLRPLLLSLVKEPRVEDLDRVLEIAPMATFFVIRGNLRGNTGDFAGAFADVQKALDTGEDLFGLRHAAALLRVGVAMNWRKSLDTASDERARVNGIAESAIESVLHSDHALTAVELRYLAARAGELGESSLARECAARLERATTVEAAATRDRK